MEPGESPDDCLLREIREETGLTVFEPELRAIVSVSDIAYPIHWLLFIYRSYRFTGELIQTDEGKLEWARLDQLDQYDRPYNDTRHWNHITGADPGVWRGKFVYDTPAKLLLETRY